MRNGDDNGHHHERMWSWVGAVVLVLAFFVGGGWATAIVMAASSRTPPITDTTADLLSTIGGVLAGGITAYIGGCVGRLTARKEYEARARENADEGP